MVVLGPARPFLPGRSRGPQEIRRQRRAPAPGARSRRQGRSRAARRHRRRSRSTPTVLANDKHHLRRRYNDSDRTILVTNRYSSHASVSTLSRNSLARTVVFAGAGRARQAPGSRRVAARSTSRSSRCSDTFADNNGDFQLPRQREANHVQPRRRGLQDASTRHAEDAKRCERAFVVGDADAFSDAVFGNEANIRSLHRRHPLARRRRELHRRDLHHRRREDRAHQAEGSRAFLRRRSSSVPALVLGLGLLLYSRRTRTKGPKRPGCPLPAPAAAEGKGA